MRKERGQKKKRNKGRGDEWKQGNKERRGKERKQGEININRLKHKEKKVM